MLKSLLGDRFGGILGAPTLSVFGFVLDFPSERVTVQYPLSTGPDALRRLGMDGATAVPLRSSKETRGFHACVARLLGEKGEAVELPLIIDTGAASTLISAEAAKKLNARKVEGGPVTATRTLGGTVKTTAYIIPRLRLPGEAGASVEVRNVQVYVPERETGPTSPRLGLDILRRYKVMLAFGEDRMLLRSAE